MRLPDGATQVGSTREFTADDLPAGLLRDHSLRAGRWGRLRVFEGCVVFVDQASGDEHLLEAPAEHVIAPQALHHLRLEGPLRCRIEFYELPSPASGGDGR